MLPIAHDLVKKIQTLDNKIKFIEHRGLTETDENKIWFIFLLTLTPTFYKMKLLNG